MRIRMASGQGQPTVLRKGKHHGRVDTAAGDDLRTIVQRLLDHLAELVLCFLQLPGAGHVPPSCPDWLDCATGRNNSQP
jgi:hypothetical protein